MHHREAASAPLQTAVGPLSTEAAGAGNNYLDYLQLQDVWLTWLGRRGAHIVSYQETESRHILGVVEISQIGNNIS